MSVYMTEEEQLEQLKKWWQQYGNIVSMIFFIVLLCFAGFRVYQWHQNKISQQASATYEKMMNEFSNKNTVAIRSFANDLITNYNRTVYADGARLTLAKIYASKDKLDQAIRELQVVANDSRMLALKQVARIRIARLLSAKQAYTQALDELNVVADQTYLPIINELKGDIYGAKGQYQEAMKAYHLAMDEVKNKGIGNLFLEMKTNEIAIKNQSKNLPDKIQPA